MTTWRLRNWWQWLFTHWWVGVPLMVGGALLGAALAQWVFPTPYWAESRLEVGYNADAVMRYPEDYKDWMLTTLDGFVTSQQVLQAVQAALPADPYWQNWSLETLASHLHPYWFDAGKWRLHAQADTPEHARTLAGVWGAVAVQQIQQAIAEGETFREADARWERLESQRQSAETALAALDEARQALQTWQQRWENGKDAAPTPAERAELRYWASFAILPPGGGTVEPLPKANASAEAYAAWAEAVQRQLQAASQAWQAELERLTTEEAEVARIRAEALKKSAGISAEWQVALAADMPGADALEAHEPALWANLTASGSGLKPAAHAVYSWKDGAAAGGFLGMLLWLALALVAALLQGERDTDRGDNHA